MKHLMLDCYGSTQKLLEDLRYFNKVMNEIPYLLNLKAVTPPHLIPYYYGKVKKDEGTSAYVILEGGHFTIHAFPLRQCYFLDIFSEDFDFDILQKYLLDNLPFNISNSSIEKRDRSIDIFDTLPYDPDEDFGPHILSEIEAKQEFKMEDMFDFLEKRVTEIGMTPITRPFVVKSTVNNRRYVSGIIMIAESHIALHYDYKTNIIYFDTFSCTSFDYTMITGILKDLGKVTSNEVVVRGTKHYSKIRLIDDTLEMISSEQWSKNIKT